MSDVSYLLICGTSVIVSETKQMVDISYTTASSFTSVKGRVSRLILNMDLVAIFCQPVDLTLYYRPQRSCGQGYGFTRICHSVNRGGGLPQCMLGYNTYTPPPEQTPPEQTPLEQTPPRKQTPREADSGIRSMSGRYAY